MFTSPQSDPAHLGRATHGDGCSQPVRCARPRRGVLFPLLPVLAYALIGSGTVLFFVLQAGCASTTRIEPAKANAERTVDNGKAKTIYRVYPPGVRP